MKFLYCTHRKGRHDYSFLVVNRVGIDGSQSTGMDRSLRTRPFQEMCLASSQGRKSAALCAIARDARAPRHDYNADMSRQVALGVCCCGHKHIKADPFCLQLCCRPRWCASLDCAEYQLRQLGQCVVAMTRDGFGVRRCTQPFVFLVCLDTRR
jgi:hypothetical protein